MDARDLEAIRTIIREELDKLLGTPARRRRTARQLASRTASAFGGHSMRAGVSGALGRLSWSDLVGPRRGPTQSGDGQTPPESPENA
jgi:hypothetical protein